MLDRKFILQNADLVAKNSARRGVDVDVASICTLESERLDALQQSQEFNRLANEISKQIPKAADNDARQALIAEGRELREKKDAAAARQDELEAKILDLQSVLPNLTHPEVPDGGEHDANELGFGKTPKPVMDFQACLLYTSPSPRD